MATYLAYIDDSRDEKSACFSAIVIPTLSWPRLHDEVIEFRRSLKRTDGINITKELHATDFVAGRGDLGAVVSKWRRSRIFDEAMDFLATRRDLRILNVCVPRAKEELGFERLITRLNTHMEKKSGLRPTPDPEAQIIVIVDQGKDYTGLVRRMRRYNVIPSRFGGQATNRPITRVIEDLVFRDSARSSLIQLADFCAFALLRSENQIASRTKYGLHLSFERLKPVLETLAFGKDPRRLGIIRDT